jgi:hypothetical protein
MSGYDSWLERPYQQMYAREIPTEAEDFEGVEFWLDGERAVVDGFEEWEDADEDGRYGGVDLVVRTGGTRRPGPLGDHWVGGRTQNMTPTQVQEILANQDEHRDEDES